MLANFQQVGRDLFISGLISSHGGNLSVIRKDRIFITRSGAMLGRLQEGDVVETGLAVDDGDYALASSELIVHRAIYKHTGAGAVLHAHPPYTVALSFQNNAIQPVDSEAKYLLDSVPVISARETIGSPEVARKIPAVLKECPVAVLRGHGTFAIGDTLEQALQYTTSLELASKIIWLQQLGGKCGN
ncbi:MAG: aldolase [Thermoanaerobacteraceae bacterium]|nr:aldolase [Thermoanaerobacteraceae bacterium]